MRIPSLPVPFVSISTKKNIEPLEKSSNFQASLNLVFLWQMMYFLQNMSFCSIGKESYQEILVLFSLLPEIFCFYFEN